MTPAEEAAWIVRVVIEHATENELDETRTEQGKRIAVAIVDRLNYVYNLYGWES